MNETELRAKVVETAKGYLGCKESDGSHKQIIDLYNSHTPLARGVKVSYNSAWCAAYVSAIAIACGLTEIMPTECSCGRMIELYQKIGRWEENDAYVPQPGDIVMYDWDDTGSGDDKGWPEHVGIVTSVSGNAMTVIEGNKSNAVGYRNMTVNGKYIRGYCLPDYASVAGSVEVSPAPEPAQTPQIRRGAKGDAVVRMQQRLIAHGYALPKHGVDGDFGSETESAVKAFQSAKGLSVDGICGPKTWAALLAEPTAKTAYTVTRVLEYKRPNMSGDDVKWAQQTLTALGYDCGEIDGIFGPDTDKGVKAFQKAKGLTVDGDIGKNTTAAMGGVWAG